MPPKCWYHLHVRKALQPKRTTHNFQLYGHLGEGLIFIRDSSQTCLGMSHGALYVQHKLQQLGYMVKHSGYVQQINIVGISNGTNRAYNSH
jgi:hypothetical protein